jgi:hypothetical protein
MRLAKAATPCRRAGRDSPNERSRCEDALNAARSPLRVGSPIVCMRRDCSQPTPRHLRDSSSILGRGVTSGTDPAMDPLADERGTLELHLHSRRRRRAEFPPGRGPDAGRCGLHHRAGPPLGCTLVCPPRAARCRRGIRDRRDRDRKFNRTAPAPRGRRRGGTGRGSHLGGGRES